MSQPPFQALIPLLVVLVATLQLIGSGSPPVPAQIAPALAPRPVHREMKSQGPSALDELRGRAPFVDHEATLSTVVDLTAGGMLTSITACPATDTTELVALQAKLAELAAQEASGRFIDHGLALTLLYGVSSSGLGLPIAESNLPSASEAAEETVDASGRIGFEEFTALVNHPLDTLELDADSYQDGESLYSYETGCGLDRSTGEVYPQPISISLPEEESKSQNLWTELSRPFAPWMQQAFRTAPVFFSLPSASDLLGLALRRIALH